MNRKEYPQVPPKVEYSLTEKVRSLIPRDRPRQYSIAKQAAEPPALDMLPQIAYCSSLPLNHSLKLSIPVTIYLPPQFIQHFLRYSACAPAKGQKNSQVSNFNQKPGYVKRAAHRRPHR